MGEDLIEGYIKELCRRVEELTSKNVSDKVSTEIHSEQLNQCLMVREQETNKNDSLAAGILSCK